uniref:F-box protein 5 n=1 Tax=Tetraodon nigroviridis TaxID=99883 RepID=H3CPS3_TETNG
MKCPRHKAAVACSADKVSAGSPAVSHPKASPLHSPIKPHFPPGPAIPPLPLDTSSTVHDKENNNSRHHNGSLGECFEDSGYLSLHNSQIEDHHGDGEDEHRGTNVHTVLQATATTESDHLNSALPIVRFQKAVCAELAKCYQKNQKYDWSIVSKVAEDHLLDRVIGRHMGCEFVDIFSSLLSRNMKNVLARILALLGGLDLISCSKVSRTWRRIISEDTAALDRWKRAKQALKESEISSRQLCCRLTRDPAVSRVVLSCMQTLASSSTPSSSSTQFRGINRKIPTPTSQCRRFNEYVKAASSLKQHESLRPCRRCGSPAKHSAEAQRATCTRPGCLFDFCTRCQEAFHSSTPCRVVQPRSHVSTSKSTPHIPGSARSKRSIRRL